MHGPDGTDHKNESVFFEVPEPERIVISHLKPDHDFRLTIILAQEGGTKTRLTWRQQFGSPEHCAQIRAVVTEANEQNLDRLEAELARMKRMGSAT